MLSVQANVVDHLKQVEQKLDIHQIDQVDFIYMINLDQRPQKFKQSVDQLIQYNIFPYRFSAVNGWELSLQTIHELGIKFEPWMPHDLLATAFLNHPPFEWQHGYMTNPELTYFCHHMTRGAIGIYLSHLSVLQDAYDSGYETIWVMEDDIQVCKNPNSISDVIRQLDCVAGKKGWDILFTDRDTRDHFGNYVICDSYARRPNFTPLDQNYPKMKKEVGDNLRQIGSRYGAYSMIIRRSGIKKILDFAFKYKIFLPYDMDWQNIPDLKMFTVLNDIVSTLPKALSDNAKPGYSCFER